MWQKHSKNILKGRSRSYLFSMFFLGVASGIPFVLISSSLTIWLATVGYSTTAIGWIFLTSIPYCLKFLWAPLIDRYHLYFFCKLFGQLRGWALASQILLILSILGLAKIHSSENIYFIMCFTFLISIFSASQDIVIDAYRIERAVDGELPLGTAFSNSGFRFGMLMGGAGTLYLASMYSWPTAYRIMGLLLLIGPLTILIIQEPRKTEAIQLFDLKIHLKTIKESFLHFFNQPNWALIIMLIFFYKISDVIPNAMSGPLLIDLKFSIAEIAYIAKTMGLLMMMLGGCIGGIVMTKAGLSLGLIICGSIQLLAPLSFSILAHTGYSISMLTFTIAAENLCCGIGTTALITYLSSLCTKKFTATQFSIIYAFSSLTRIFLSVFSGWIADYFAWDSFFFCVTLVGLPSVFIAASLRRYTLQSITPTLKM